MVDEIKRDLARRLRRARRSCAAAGRSTSASISTRSIRRTRPAPARRFPGGLTSYEALRLVRALAGVSIVGCDVVEISPDHDPSGNTALVAATLLAEMLAAVAKTRGSRAASHTLSSRCACTVADLLRASQCDSPKCGEHQ